MGNSRNSFQIKIILIVCIVIVLLAVLFADLILADVISVPFLHRSEQTDDSGDKDADEEDEKDKEEVESGEDKVILTESQTEMDGTYIDISADKLRLTEEGDQEYLGYSTDISDESTIEWDSENPDIAKVNANGKVTAVSQGTTFITASSGSLSDRCTVVCDFTTEQKPAAQPTTQQPSQPTPAGDAYYILPDSNSRYLAVSDISYLSKKELRLARNEIYARHGRRFKDSELQNYFDSQSWYRGTVSADAFNEGVLNTYEKKNAELILGYEKQMGD
ncbi:MAG: YARHG domain-containing protein [Eubacterium sp.]|nr:YARHG domain-containing protein [Eubacterium sp.]